MKAEAKVAKIGSTSMSGPSNECRNLKIKDLRHDVWICVCAGGSKYNGAIKVLQGENLLQRIVEAGVAVECNVIRILSADVEHEFVAAVEKVLS